MPLRQKSIPNALDLGGWAVFLLIATVVGPCSAAAEGPAVPLRISGEAAQGAFVVRFPTEGGWNYQLRHLEDGTGWMITAPVVAGNGCDTRVADPVPIAERDSRWYQVEAAPSADPWAFFADLYVDMEAGVVGDAVNSAIAASATHGFLLAPTWVFSANAAGGGIRVVEGSRPLLHSVGCGVGLFGGCGSRMWEADVRLQTNFLSCRLGGDFDRVTLGSWFSVGCGVSFTSYNFLYIGGRGDFSALNLFDDPDQPSLSIETERSQNPARIPVRSNAWYWVTLSFQRNGTNRLEVFDDQGRLMGISEGLVDDHTANVVSLGRIDAHDEHPAVKAYFDNLVIAVGSEAPVPLGPAPVGVPEPPVLSNVRAEDIDGDRAIVRWTTDIHADSVVRFGASGGEQTAVDGTGTRDHEVVLPGLLPGTTYRYVASSTVHGATATSGPFQFTTSECVLRADWSRVVDRDYESATKLISQRFRNESPSPVTVCSARLKLYTQYGILPAHVQLRSAPDGQGVQFGGDSTTVTVGATPELYALVFTNAVVPGNTDFYLTVAEVTPDTPYLRVRASGPIREGNETNCLYRGSERVPSTDLYCEIVARP